MKKGLVCGLLLTAIHLPFDLQIAYGAEPIIAQAGVPNTRVDFDQGNASISGGKLVGANLFHSFQEFNIKTNTSATFINPANSNPSNIISRVVGGNPSYIDGKLIAHSDNFYFLNPAGIMFGRNASLDGSSINSFVASSANAIRFKHPNIDGESWFKSTGDNGDYSQFENLEPKDLAFVDGKFGSVINTGILSISTSATPNSSLGIKLFGNNVINIGKIIASSADMRGFVKLSAIFNDTDSTFFKGTNSPFEVNQNFTPKTLPELVTGASTAGLEATGLEVKNGQVVLTDYQRTYPDESGQVILANEINASEIDILGKTTTVVDANNQATKLTAAFGFTITGEEKLKIDTLANQDSLLSGYSLIFSSKNNPIELNGRIDSSYLVDFDNDLIIHPSIGNEEGYISSAGNITFGDYAGPALKIEAGGDINGGNISIYRNNTLLQGDDPDFDILRNSSSLILTAGKNNLTNDINISSTKDVFGTTFTETNSSTGTGNINVGDISTGDSVILTAAGDIKTGNISANGGFNAGTLYSGFILRNGDVIRWSRNNDKLVENDEHFFDLYNQLSGIVSLTAETGNIEVSTIRTAGKIDDSNPSLLPRNFSLNSGDINIQTGGYFRATGILDESATRLNEVPIPRDKNDGRGSCSFGSSICYNVPSSINTTGPLNSGNIVINTLNNKEFLAGPIIYTDQDDKPIVGEDGYVKGRPLNATDVPANASFTAGAVLSINNNGGRRLSHYDFILSSESPPIDNPQNPPDTGNTGGNSGGNPVPSPPITIGPDGNEGNSPGNGGNPPGNGGQPPGTPGGNGGDKNNTTTLAAQTLRSTSDCDNKSEECASHPDSNRASQNQSGNILDVSSVLNASPE